MHFRKKKVIAFRVGAWWHIHTILSYKKVITCGHELCNRVLEKRKVLQERIIGLTAVYSKVMKISYNQFVLIKGKRTCRRGISPSLGAKYLI